jgi:hypothetical protein
MAGFSKPLLLVSTHPMFGSYNPKRQVFWFRLVPFRSPLLRESRLISFPRGNEMFQFPPFASPSLCIQEGILKVCLSGFPHSEISGSKVICTSPKLIAAYRVLHRRQMPRHPPCALVYFQLHLQSFGKIRIRTSSDPPPDSNISSRINLDRRNFVQAQTPCSVSKKNCKNFIIYGDITSFETTSSSTISVLLRCLYLTRNMVRLRKISIRARAEEP